MNMLLGYFGLVFLLALLGLIVVLNFLRYRYKGDLTIFFLSFFIVSFLAITFFTLSLIDTNSLNSQADTFNSFE